MTTDAETQAPLYYKTVSTSTEHCFYISKEIGEPREFIDMVHTIQSVHEDDVVRLILNTRGGRLDTTVQILNAIRECKAHVVTILDGDCLSAGSLILLAGHEIVIKPNAQLMVHMYTSGAYGKGGDITKEVAATDSWAKELYREAYKDFLTEEEITGVFNGTDIWLEFEEINERVIKLNASRDKQAEQVANTALQEIKDSLEGIGE
jgi:ATP-dependent protease ClpP protease subunit